MEATEARMDATEEKFNKRMDAIAKIIHHGMRLLVTNKEETDRKVNALIEAQLGTEASLKELAAAQKVTDQKLQAFIDSLQQGRNGH